MSANHVGSVGKMKVSGINGIFSKVPGRFPGVRIRGTLATVTLRTYNGLVGLNPFRNEFPVMHSKCIGNVEKRIDSRLRNVQKSKKKANMEN